MLQLRVVRMARGWTIWELGRRSGISVGRVSMIERGLVPATPEEREKLSRAAGGSADKLFQPVVVEDS